jgi:uncharacterized protein YkwD
MKNRYFLTGLLAATAGVAMLATVPFQAIARPAAPGHHRTFTTAQMLTPPFPLDGKPVYISSAGKWREARLTGYRWNTQTGFLYSAVYPSNNQTEQNITTDLIISLATAQARGIATTVYDVSSQAGITQMVNAHNAIRSQYGVPNLTWSTQLASYAQQWANTLLQNGKFEHRSNSPYGENLATASGQMFSPERVVNLWGAESKYYNYASNSCAAGQVCGHFTQIVWRNTTQVGCGVARNAQREVWVCNYNPPGNIIGRKPY